MNDEMLYQNLAKHLDSLPEGYPATESGVELRILKYLFIPEYASLAVHLQPTPQPAEAVAQRAGLEAAKVAEMLEDMSAKGLIFSIKPPAKEAMYMAAPFVIGIWEYQLNRLEPEFNRMVREYMPEFQKASQHLPPQLRTIPVGKSIDAKGEVLVYEQARELIKGQKKIVVSPCICRKEHKMMGEGCDKPLESCLSFGWGADYYERNGLGRAIDETEALAVLQRAEETGLVLQPSNAQKIVALCCCCGDCCETLKAFKMHPKPASLASSAFVASVNRDECIGCETCLERCQMEALTIDDDSVAVVDLDRCIGCGLCVTTCPTGAISLERKPEGQIRPVPANMMDAYMERMQLRAQAEVADRADRLTKSQ